MAQFDGTQPRRLHLSLSARVSMLLVLVAMLPLVVTVTCIELISRPALIAQASRQMETDAQNHTQLIDNYFSERLLGAEALSRLAPIQGFLAGDTMQQGNALRSLATGHGRGSFYEDWSLLDLQGNVRLYYPTKPLLHGQHYIQPDKLQQVLVGRKSVISDVFFSPASNEAYLDIYTPVLTASYKLVGVLRTSFDLQYVWQTVDSEAGSNGNGSYAFIVDHNNVRIAYTRTNAGVTTSSAHDAPSLFKAVAAPSQQMQQLALSAGLYGWRTGSELTLADPVFANADNVPTTFQTMPAEQQTTYQVARSATFTVPWNYYVLSPLSTVTSVADQQLLVALAITSVVLVLAALIGMRIGRGITRPILRSVNSLIGSSQALKGLSEKQRSAAEEQKWVVEASQMGLQRVEYYTKASNAAVDQLSEAGTSLAQNWQYLSEQDLRRTVQKMVAAAQYIRKARTYQEESDKNLAAAIRVTIGVTEQLSKGATSAAESANELEEVVNQLRAVVR